MKDSAELVSGDSSEVWPEDGVVGQRTVCADIAKKRSTPAELVADEINTAGGSQR